MNWRVSMKPMISSGSWVVFNHLRYPFSRAQYSRAQGEAIDGFPDPHYAGQTDERGRFWSESRRTWNFARWKVAEDGVCRRTISPRSDQLAGAQCIVCRSHAPLEALRAADEPLPLVFTLNQQSLRRPWRHCANSDGGIYYPTEMVVRANGIDELRPLDLHSPYGCSKGVADQYIIDYARTFGLPAVVFRMSCIYGSHQIGNEDQGRVAHFPIHALDGQTTASRCVMLSTSMIWSTHSYSRARRCRGSRPRLSTLAAAGAGD